MIVFKTGDLITFRYSKIGVHDTTPVVAVIAPLFNNLVHGINVKYLLPGTERRILLAILDAEFRKNPQVQLELNRFQYLKQILETDDIENALKIPQALYVRYIKPIMQSDSYRTYHPMYMSGIRILTNKQIVLTAMRRI